MLTAKVVFCQNRFYIFEALPKISWQDFGIDHVLGSSKEIQNTSIKYLDCHLI